MHFCCCAPAQSVGLRNKYDILERDEKPGNKLLLIQMNKKPTQVERGLPRGKAFLKIKLFAQAFWKILLSFMCQRLGEGGWLRNAGPPGFPSPCRQCWIVFFFSWGIYMESSYPMFKEEKSTKSLNSPWGKDSALGLARRLAPIQAVWLAGQAFREESNPWERAGRRAAHSLSCGAWGGRDRRIFAAAPGRHFCQSLSTGAVLW